MHSKKAFTIVGRESKGKAFTIIELLVSIVIIGLMIALLIPNIDRSLNKNQIVNDVDLFKAKLEETRILSGSTQQDDNSAVAYIDDIGYYSLVIPTSGSDYFDIVKISYSPDLDEGLCRPSIAVAQVNDPGFDISKPESCIIERVKLSKNITLTNDNSQIIAFKVPTQKFLTIQPPGIGWTEEPPVFTSEIFTLNLSSQGLTAIINLDNYTGRVTAVYTDNNN